MLTNVYHHKSTSVCKVQFDWLKELFLTKIEIIFVCYIINGHAPTLFLFLEDKNTSNISITAELLRWNI